MVKEIMAIMDPDTANAPGPRKSHEDEPGSPEPDPDAVQEDDEEEDDPDNQERDERNPLDDDGDFEEATKRLVREQEEEGDAEGSPPAYTPARKK